MPYEITYDADNECVMSRMTGQLDEQTIRAFIAEMALFLNQHHCTRILNDLRAINDLSSTLTTYKIYTMPQYISQAGYPPETKRAIVFNEVEDENLAFFETVSRNQGQRVAVFTDFGEALEWLTSG
jgi:hypothetical protein